MTSWQIEHIRLSLLRHLAEGAPFALGEPLLLQCLGSEGWPVCERVLRQELEYLAGKGLAEPAPKILSPENRAWRVTAAGRDHMALAFQ